jgi:hypothetical protein
VYASTAVFIGYCGINVQLIKKKFTPFFTVYLFAKKFFTEREREKKIFGISGAPFVLFVLLSILNMSTAGKL